MTHSHCKRLGQLDATRLLRFEQGPHDGLFGVIRLHRVAGCGADTDVSEGCECSNRSPQPLHLTCALPGCRLRLCQASTSLTPAHAISPSAKSAKTKSWTTPRAKACRWRTLSAGWARVYRTRSTRGSSHSRRTAAYSHASKCQGSQLQHSTPFYRSRSAACVALECPHREHCDLLPGVCV